MTSTSPGPSATADHADADAPAPLSLHFPLGLPGFPDAKDFVVERWGDLDTPFSVMRGTSRSVEFLVVDPEVFFPDYDAVIDGETAAMLELDDAAQGRVLVIVTATGPARDATANLLGPIVYNPSVGRAVQAVMSDRWSTRHRLVPA
jgi:flagellar assembly factor FliW